MYFKKPYHVVIIDDDSAILDLLRKYLEDFESESLQVSTFENANEALKFIDQSNVQIVITDLQLNNYHGEDIITECLEMEKGLQVVALSQDTRVITALDCFNRGARYYLDKPVDRKLFNAVVNDCICFLDRWHDIIKNHLRHG